MDEFATVLYYLIASNLLDAGGSDGDCLTMAWCLEQLTEQPVLTEELARSKSESMDYRLLVMGIEAGDRMEHHDLLREMTPERLLRSRTYEDAVKAIMQQDKTLALGPNCV